MKSKLGAPVCVTARQVRARGASVRACRVIFSRPHAPDVAIQIRVGWTPTPLSTLPPPMPHAVYPGTTARCAPLASTPRSLSVPSARVQMHMHSVPSLASTRVHRPSFLVEDSPSFLVEDPRDRLTPQVQVIAGQLRLQAIAG
ncbi:hypothetical protein C8R43DRAFT_1140368 [Mycena crocata]|nr:hypothetical protein C8R43DRAFT_1140368 [Mycena crocata]